MSEHTAAKTRGDDSPQPILASVSLALFGLIAPMVTFLLAVSNLSVGVKMAGLALIAVVYAGVCVWSFQKLRTSVRSPSAASTDRSAAAVDEGQFFGSSLRSDDVFRFVTSRIEDVMPHRASILFIADGDQLRVCNATEGELAQHVGKEFPSDEGLAGMAFISGEPEVDRELSITSDEIRKTVPNPGGSSAAVPLIHNELTFGVLQIFFDEGTDLSHGLRENLSSLGSRIAPLFLGSIAFERSLSNALTDPLTGLPNERTFVMVLENQLAESQRFRDERPLTVVAIDIKGFEQLTAEAGGSTSEDTLKAVATMLRTELRRMDFLAHSENDEFLAILPTATREIADEIVERITRSFETRTLTGADGENFVVRLNFGAASFWHDGETSDQLMRHARLEKQKLRSEDADNVIWFPKQYVN